MGEIDFAADQAMDPMRIGREGAAEDMNGAGSSFRRTNIVPLSGVLRSSAKRLGKLAGLVRLLAASGLAR